MPYLFRHLGSVGLIVIAKAASTSIKQAVSSQALGTEERFLDVAAVEFARLPVRVAFIREPHQRAESAYKMFTMRGGIPEWPRENLSAFVLAVCSDNRGDQHLIPQWKYCAPNGVLIANRLIKWDFAELESLIGLPIPHLNASAQKYSTGWCECIWSDEAREAFDRTYADDIALWGEQ